MQIIIDDYDDNENNDDHDNNSAVAGAKPKPGARPARGSLRQEGWIKLCDHMRIDHRSIII